MGWGFWLSRMHNATIALARKKIFREGETPTLLYKDASYFQFKVIQLELRYVLPLAGGAWITSDLVARVQVSEKPGPFGYRLLLRDMQSYITEYTASLQNSVKLMNQRLRSFAR